MDSIEEICLPEAKENIENFFLIYI